MTKLLHTLISQGGRRNQKRVARGGKRGKTAGRGTKGQRARAGHKIRPEIRDMIKKLPKRRGYGKNRAQSRNSGNPDAVPVSLKKIEAVFHTGDTVSPSTLIEKGLVTMESGSTPIVKILGKDGLTKKIIVERCSVSAGAQAAIEALGGTIVA